MALTALPSTGSQGTTQNPQTVPTAQTLGGGTATQSKGVQPGTAQSVLTSNQGIGLGGSQLTTVNLSASSTAQSQAKEPVPAKHHVNGALLGASIALVVVAVVLFWAVGRSAKNTTD